MNNQKQALEILLHIPPKMWQQFRQSMLKYRSINEEVIGFFFCQRQQVSKNQVRYIPRAWIVPLPDCYERQSTSGLILTQQFHWYLIKSYLSQGLHVVHIHTHAGNISPNFSDVDDRYESEYSQFLASSFPKKPRLISGVFDESLQQSQFRIWDRKGKSYHSIKCYQSWLAIPEDGELVNNLNANNINPMFMRQKIFGDTCQKQLNQLKVTLIGCGGIGSIFAELLGRLGVKNWVLIDPDRLEQVNLNRMPGATQKMVEQQWYKVDYVKYLIKKIYQTGSCVKTIPTSIENDLAKQEIAASDLIVVATDNHLSRKIAQELALEYMRPLVCLGTHIDIKKSDNTPRMYCRVTVPPLGGGWCLMCGNIINLQRAALESAPLEINQIAAGAGYLEGINDPAVFWLNSICASTGVGVIHGMVSGFLNLEAGIDWIYEFPGSVWHKTNIEHLETPDCYFCSTGNRE
ncbi:MAG: ThiF family adenylyltransferase [Nostoc sp. CmiSLP01]|nr:ThiF family adenylyltransferase [Nostoc sp. CmiSLP01]MDZ8289060.1 ThiF family adenylyltransferase [Nostoc sp. ChiSLP01]